MEKVYRIFTVFGEILVVAESYKEAEEIFRSEEDYRCTTIEGIKRLPEELIRRIKEGEMK